jgi:hypothetical protein
MRQRIEDLGRLSVMLKTLAQHDIFDDRPCRNKDYLGWFSQQPEEKRDDIIRTWVYQLDELNEKLWEMVEIADGNDILNKPEDYS